MALREYVPEHIWLQEYPVRYAGCDFFGRMTVIRLGDRRLFLHSPCKMTASLAQEIKALGTVAFIIAPGNYHYLHVDSCQRMFPDAQTFICPGVERRRSGIRFDGMLADQPDPAWAGDLDQVLIRGNRLMCEAVMFHRASATLIVVDVLENIGDHTPGTSRALRFWWKFVFRMWNRPKPAPEYQLGWKDRRAARISFERILAWPFERVVLAHGDLIESDAQETVRRAWRSLLQDARRGRNTAP